MATRPKKIKPKVSASSKLEEAFLKMWLDYLNFEPVREYRFHPVRRWRFDFAWPDMKIAVEIEGGTFSGGRHTRGYGYEADCEKYNAASVLGWRILRFTGRMLKNDGAGCVKQVADLLGR